MDLEIQVKEEEAWLEEPANTSLEKVQLESQMIPLKEQIKSELTEPGPTEENTLKPSADIKEEIFVEQQVVDQLVPYFKEENNLENVPVLAVHSGEGVHRCMVCSMMFRFNFNLRKHLLIHSSDSRSFHCEVSNGSSTKQCQNTNHLVSRSRRQYNCGICNKTFTRRRKLVTHMYVHSGERPFSCAECGSTFARKDILKLHMVTHSTERPFRCEQCNRAFTRKDSLREHMVTHTGERRYSCNDCNRTFVMRSSLTRHMLVHSEQRNFCCVVCNSMFKNKWSLRRHMLSHTRKDFCI